MIISASTRTDIPAFYSEWFYNRLREGFVYVRNPYNSHQVNKYRLSPDLVDAIVLWTKNPLPMMERLDELAGFYPYFFVTVTPYGKEIEPFVPDSKTVLSAILALSKRFGKDSVCLRYDPIIINETYTVAYHERAFYDMLKRLSGAISECVISFVDIYEKTKRTYMEARPMSMQEMEDIAARFAVIGKENGIRIKTCAEAIDLSKYGIYNAGCISKEMMEKHLKTTIKVPAHTANRANCTCIESKDIGVYNTCLHGCRYCYANYDTQTVKQNIANHDVNSPFLIGGSRPEDIIKEAKQVSIRDGQIRFDFLS